MTAQQQAGTLERVVEYVQNAFSKAWNYLAEPNDDGGAG